MKAIIENGKINDGIRNDHYIIKLSAKIPYTLIAHLRVLAKCGSRFCFMYHGL